MNTTPDNTSTRPEVAGVDGVPNDDSKASKGAPKWVMPVALVLLAVAISLVSFQVGRATAPVPEAAPAATQQAAGQEQGAGAQSTDPAKPDAQQEEIRQTLLGVPRRDEKEVNTYGPVDAPVAMVIYSDYQCGFCARFSAETLPALKARADKGELRIEIREVNLFGDASRLAAQGSHAAGLQGKYWEFHDALFPNGGKLDSSQLTEEGLTALAGELGLDTEKFKADLTSAETVQVITDNENEGRMLGVSSTPAFVIGGSAMMGAQPLEAFNKMIDSELALAKKG